MAHRKLCATLQSCASSAEAQLVCLQVVGRTHQMLDVVSPRTYIGSGKVEEIVGAVAELQADTLIFDDELTPGQLRNLEKACALQGNCNGQRPSPAWPLKVLWGWSRLGIWAAAGYICLPEAWQPANQKLQQQAATLLAPLICVARVAGTADTSQQAKNARKIYTGYVQSLLWLQPGEGQTAPVLPVYASAVGCAATVVSLVAAGCGGQGATV